MADPNQKQLFEKYIFTLREEIQCKDNERDTVYAQLDQLLKENQRLTNQMDIDDSNRQSTIRVLREDNLHIKQAYQQLMAETQLKQQQIISLSQELDSKSQQIQQFSTEMEHNSTEIYKVTALSTEIMAYKTKQQESENLINQYREAFTKIEAENESLSKEITSVRKASQSEKTTMQSRIKELQNQKLSLSKDTEEVKQLQSKLNILQDQNQTLHSRITQLQMLEAQVTTSKTTLSFKEKEIETLNEALRKFRQDLELLQQMLSDKDQQIEVLEHRLTLESDKNSTVSSQTTKSIKEFEVILTNYEKQIKKFSAIIDDQNKTIQDNEKKIHKLHLMEISHQTLAKQHETLKSLYEQSNKQLNSYRSRLEEETIFRSGHSRLQSKDRLKQQEIDQNDKNELKAAIEELRTQLNQVKEVNEKIKQENTEMKGLINETVQTNREGESTRKNRGEVTAIGNVSEVYSKRLHAIREQPQIASGSRVEPMASGSRVESMLSGRYGKHHSPDFGGRESVNRQKWEDLQYKIQILRDENNVLKNNLYK